MDGPDNNYNWIKEGAVEVRNKRHCHGGGLMVHGFVAYDGYIRVTRVSGKINSLTYQNILTDVFDLIQTRYSSFIWMQDNAPPHASRNTKTVLEENEITTLKWPPRSPDLNIMEKIWAELSRLVYADKQYKKIEDLWSSIQLATETLNSDENKLVEQLYNSIPDLIFNVIKKDGDIIE